jgi:hypothetical protein
MDDQKVDSVTLDMFTAQSLERHTKRFIAGVLSDRESFTGVKNKKDAQTVKDMANFSKRIMLTKLTGMQVESAFDDPSKRNAAEKPHEADNGSN